MGQAGRDAIPRGVRTAETATASHGVGSAGAGPYWGSDLQKMPIQ
jgi:hypothetical protein